MPATTDLETAELLTQLIKNACVNDGTEESGFEDRNADLLQGYLEGAGLDVERFTSTGTRTSIVARIDGTDNGAEKVCLMGHTDVVPVNADGWDEDPFGGELIDGEIWGRGALDMLGVTASMAVAVKRLATSGFRPRGDLIFLGVADEEAGGVYGAKFLSEHHWDAIACDYVLTELGGFWSGDKTSVSIQVAEKGLQWRRLVISGTPGHGSMPYRTDNALVKCAQIVQRISGYKPSPVLDELWRERIRTSGLPLEFQEDLLDPIRLDDALARFRPASGRALHAAAHTTMSCNVVSGGQKTNIIPDRVCLDVDIRTLPGVSGDDVDALLNEILGDLAADVTIEVLEDHPSSASPMETPMWEALRRQVARRFDGAGLTPTLMTGGTDARYFREHGTVAYGASLFSPALDLAAVGARFHGHNERIDLESLELSTELFTNLPVDLLS